MNRFTATATLVLAILQCNDASAIGREFTCAPAFGEMGRDYPRLVCAGNDLMERGNPKKALDLYQRASTIEFFESPNFLIYFRIAWAEAALGHKEEAKSTLRDLDGMLSIYTGELACRDDVSVLPSRAISVMCQPIFGEESYTSQTGLGLRRSIAKEYRERAKSLARHYGLHR